MPWTAPDPFTGARHWRPNELELLSGALQECWSAIEYDTEFAFADLADWICGWQDIEGESVGARRARLYVEVLRRHPHIRIRKGRVGECVLASEKDRRLRRRMERKAKAVG